MEKENMEQHMFISIKSHVGNNHWEVTEICDEQKTN